MHTFKAIHTQSRQSIVVVLYTHASFFDQEAHIKQVLYRLTEAAWVDGVLEQRRRAGGGDVALAEDGSTTVGLQFLHAGEAGIAYDLFSSCTVLRKMVAYARANGCQAILVRLPEILATQCFRSCFTAGCIF